MVLDGDHGIWIVVVVVIELFAPWMMIVALGCNCLLNDDK